MLQRLDPQYWWRCKFPRWRLPLLITRIERGFRVVEFDLGVWIPWHSLRVPDSKRLKKWKKTGLRRQQGARALQEEVTEGLERNGFKASLFEIDFGSWRKLRLVPNDAEVVRKNCKGTEVWFVPLDWEAPLSQVVHGLSVPNQLEVRRVFRAVPNEVVSVSRHLVGERTPFLPALLALQIINAILTGSEADL